MSQIRTYVRTYVWILKPQVNFYDKHVGNVHTYVQTHIHKCSYIRTHIQWDLSNLPQLGMSVLCLISGVGGLTRFALSTCIVHMALHFSETRADFQGRWIIEVSLFTCTYVFTTCPCNIRTYVQIKSNTDTLSNHKKCKWFNLLFGKLWTQSEQNKRSQFVTIICTYVCVSTRSVCQNQATDIDTHWSTTDGGSRRNKSVISVCVCVCLCTCVYVCVYVRVCVVYVHKSQTDNIKNYIFKEDTSPNT